MDVIFNIRYYLAMFVMLLMPRRPYTPPDMVYTWEIFFKTVRWRHVVLGVIGVASTIGMLNLFLRTMPFTQYTLFSSLAAGINYVIVKLTGHPANESVMAYVVIAILVAGRGSPGIFPAKVMGKGIPAWAMLEEQAFRSGAENWNPIQKFFASLAFGFLHFNNIIYPIAACLAITVGGVYYTAIYTYTFRKTGNARLALRESAAVHTVHNIIAFTILGCIIVYFLSKIVWIWIH